MTFRTSLAAGVLAALAFLPFQVSAQDTLLGDKRLACEAILCLATPTRPQECAASVARYFSISLKKFKDTMKARKKFLSMCPQSDAESVARIVSETAPEPDPEPEPTPLVPPGPPQSIEQIQAEIARLTPIWNEQTALSGAARNVVEECVRNSGRVQDGYCSAEMADYDAKRLPAIAMREEIYRLQALLTDLGNKLP